MADVLEATFGQAGGGKLDFNNASRKQLVERLREPLQAAGAQMNDEQLHRSWWRPLNFRNTPPRPGLIKNFDQLSGVPGANSTIINVLKQQCYLAPFNIRSVDMVGPKVGAELRQKAVAATFTHWPECWSISPSGSSGFMEWQP